MLVWSAVLAGSIYWILELQRKAESYFQHTERTFPSDTRQGIKLRMIAKHLTEPK